MKVSLVFTVLNEEDAIGRLLKSIKEQSKYPDEIIIVDGGSTDKTVTQINNSELKNLRLLETKGVNRSQGRNRGVAQARHAVVALTDAGCVLGKNWLEEIVGPFSNPQIMAVAGYYRPVAKTAFQRALVPYVCKMPEQIKGGFLPSSRSVAFRKKVWTTVGGYPNHLNYCEDLYFNQKVKKAGFKFFFNQQAVVYWPQRESLGAAWRQFYHYAYGDGQVMLSRYQTHTFKIVLIYLRYLLWLFVLVSGFIMPVGLWLAAFSLVGYLLWAAWKNHRYVRGAKEVIWLPVIQITADLAVMLGAGAGMKKSCR